MRILIIGGTRFSGAIITRRLAHMGHEICLFHRNKTQRALPQNVRHIYGDRDQLDDFKDELRQLAPEVVIDMMALNAAHAKSVIQVFTGHAQHLVAISSQDVYQTYGKLIGIESGPAATTPLDEDAPLREKLYPYRDENITPENRYYHYEKIFIERAFMQNTELPATILRYPMVYGPHDYQHRLHAYLKRMEDRRPAILLDQGMANWRCTRSYVENAAAAVVMAATDARAKGKIYNVGEADALSEAAWVRSIGEAAGWQGQIVSLRREELPQHLDPGIDTAQHLVTSSQRIRAELDYQESVSRADALQQTVKWERENPPDNIDPQAFDYEAEDRALATALK